MTSLILLSVLAAKPQGAHTNATPPGDPVPGYISVPYAPTPESVGTEISGPDTVTIPSGSNSSPLFGINVTKKDQDTFEENRPTGYTYPVYGTSSYLTVSPLSANGTLTPQGGTGEQAFEYVNTTNPSVSAGATVDRFNYHAVLIHDTSYPLERVMAFKVVDTTPPGPVPGDSLQSWRIHDTNQPVVSLDITVVRQ